MSVIIGRELKTTSSSSHHFKIYKLTSLSALLVLLELVALEKEEREMSTVTAINSDVTPAATAGQPALPSPAV